jgi:predicted Zn-dependent protease
MSLSLKPDNPHVLNNLAWLYVTCEDETIRNPHRALVLAQKAAALEEESHILDTLAESYFSNGMIEEAVAAGKRALALAEENKAYYLEQLQKFKQAR